LIAVVFISVQRLVKLFPAQVALCLACSGHGCSQLPFSEAGSSAQSKVFHRTSNVNVLSMILAVFGRPRPPLHMYLVAVCLSPAMDCVTNTVVTTCTESAQPAVGSANKARHLHVAARRVAEPLRSSILRFARDQRVHVYTRITGVYWSLHSFKQCRCRNFSLLSSTQILDLWIMLPPPSAHNH
jgi:hypothetical protein